MTQQSTETALATAPAVTLPSHQQWATIMDMGRTLVRSGFLPAAVRTPEAAAAIILKGRELGIPPMQAFSHVHIIQGRPTCSSELMLALLARGGVTWEWVHDGSNGRAEIAFTRPGFGRTTGSFSREQAQAAKLTGKETWRAYEANMLRARAISNGARMIGPDLLAGMSYTPEEIGAEVDEDEAPLDAQYSVEPTPEAAPNLAEVRRLMAAECITDKERAGIEKRISAGMTAEQADAAIEWLRQTIQERTPDPSEDQAAEAAASSEGEGVPAGEQVHPISWDAWLKLAKHYRTILGDDAYYFALARWEAEHADKVEASATAEIAAALHEAARALAAKDAPPPSNQTLIDSLHLKKDDLVESIEALEGIARKAGIEPPRAAYGIGEDAAKHVVAELRTYYARLLDVVSETQKRDS